MPLKCIFNLKENAVNFVQCDVSSISGEKMSIIGDNIRALRDLEGLTQQELADAIQVTRETVNKWESGAIETLREHNVETLRHRFSLSIDDLRSETNGLAAKQARAQGASGYSPNGFSVEIPMMAQSLLQRHPHAFTHIANESMTRVIPMGCRVLIDPDMQERSGSIVLVELLDGTNQQLELRRIHLGTTKALLSAESYEGVFDDVVIDYNQIAIKGVAFWFQPCDELS